MVIRRYSSWTACNNWNCIYFFPILILVIFILMVIIIMDYITEVVNLKLQKQAWKIKPFLDINLVWNRLIPWRKSLPENLMVAVLMKKFSAVYRTRDFITTFNPLLIPSWHCWYKFDIHFLALSSVNSSHSRSVITRAWSTKFWWTEGRRCFVWIP
jgi:hypothetical protein